MDGMGIREITFFFPEAVCFVGKRREDAAGRQQIMRRRCCRTMRATTKTSTTRVRRIFSGVGGGGLARDS